MQLGTRLSIASIRFGLCAAFIACGLSARVSAQDASATIGGSAAASTGGAAPAAESSSNERPWALLHRAFNTWDGSTGGMFLEDPGMGMPGAVRLQLGLSLFSGEDFFYDGDEVEQNTQSLTLSVTALEILELHAALLNRGTTSTLPTMPPRTGSLHSFADIAFGGKLGWSVTEVVRLGGGLRFLMRSDVGPEAAMLDSPHRPACGCGVDLQRRHALALSYA